VLGTQNSFQASGAPITQGTNTAQLNNAYTGAQGALNQQQGVTNTLNQGLNQGAGSQQALTNMYLQQASGQGPNPAVSELNQNTGQLIAQQAGLAGGQRGAGANVGLIASQNAAQGSATQQAAVGQAATLGAQQQLAAESNLQNLAASQVGQGSSATQGLNNAQQNEQNILQGANTAANNAAVSQQSNINNVNASVAAGNQNQNGNIISGIGGALSSGLAGISSLFAHGGMVKMDKGGNVLDANARKHIAPHNFALPNGRYPIHDINHARNALARVSQNGTPEEKAKVRAAVHSKYPSIKSECGGGYMAAGGMVAQPKNYAMGGGVTGQSTSGPQSYVGNWLNSSVNSSGPNIAPAANIGTNPTSPLGFLPGALASAPPPAEDEGEMAEPQEQNITAQPGQGVPQLDLPTNDLSSPQAANFQQNNITAAPAAPNPFMNTFNEAYGGLMDSGGKVKANKPGEKAVKKGDSLDNDKVPAMLSEGELVIPRHIMMAPNAPARAAQFVAQQIAKKGKR
jgi:hypothetical protein